MSEWLDLFVTAFQQYASYMWREITHPHWHNYFYWLIAISLAVYGWELIQPWRVYQARLRRDFWLDAFYMFFNFFIFSLVGYHAASEVAVHAFRDMLTMIGVEHTIAIRLNQWPVWSQLLALFVVRDFIHFNVHRLLHRVPFLWRFHQVHHSIVEMGFAGHLRYHWMENVVYRSLEYIPLAMIGFGIQEFIIVHLAALSIGHLNHANLVLPLGPLRFLFNSPQMHIWHHVKQLPEDHPYGINFGISLSLWDYLFGTACIPSNGRDIELGFPGDESFPRDFVSHIIWGFRRTKNSVHGVPDPLVGQHGYQQKR
ncbi:MAG: sterol desaturase family protein [Acidobacteria bacterium]|nr:sterol desaturase family protein [Acidobacteriota bacterium]